MVLQPGARLGPYEVIAAVGAGGMGEVYRARDTRLKRDVALKVLPSIFATDPDRLARFQREAELLASLNHPHIAAIYGIEEGPAEAGHHVHAIVLELVEGETLADRIARGPVPLGEALTLTGQIAAALDAAHEQGVVHRDLKPSNIVVTPQGVVKVLDFGLAKLSDERAAARPDITASPTITSPALSAVGVLIGTAAYMAPEQARGRPADKRADVWAFGCVLYEMLKGRRAFPGSDLTEVLGAVIHKEPDYLDIPAQVQPLLRRCLEKDPQKRLRGVGDAMSLIDLAAPAASARGATPWIGWAAAAVCLVLGAVLAWLYFGRETPAPRPVRFQFAPPPNTAFTSWFAVSPDGRHVAFHAAETGGSSLWLYSLDSGMSRRLATATNGGIFWSPDSRFIGFSGFGTLYKVDIAGGAPQRLAEVSAGWAGGAWNSKNEIVFGQGSGPLMRISADGGTPTPVTEVDPSREEFGHGGPRFLPDGRHFLYGRAAANPANAGVFVGSLDNAPGQQPATPVLVTQNRPMFVATPDARRSYLLFLRETTLMAQRFDTDALTLVGEPIVVAEQVGSTIAANAVLGFFAASSEALAYRAGTRALSTPVLVDRSGGEIASISVETLENPQHPAVSPDGRSLALIAEGDLWVYDLARGRPPIKLTFGARAFSPLWTLDGRRLLFEINGRPMKARRGSETIDAPSLSLLAIPADGSTSIPEVVVLGSHVHPYGWSADGRDLLLTRLPGGVGEGPSRIL